MQLSSLARLFLKPNSTLLARGQQSDDPDADQPRRNQDWGAQASPDGVNGDDYGDDDDDDCGGGFGDYGGGGGYDSGADEAGGEGGAGGGSAAGGWFDDDLGIDQDPEMQLLQAPRRVAQVGVNYSRSSKQVDVHALKDIIWKGLQHARRGGSGDGSEAEASNGRDGMEEEGVEEEAEGGEGAAAVDFREVIKAVPERSAAGRLEDMSVHMCFICLLHLANQHGLEVKSGQDLRTLVIRQGKGQPAL